MLQTLKNAWKTKEIRGKILFTLFILLLYRLGAVIPVPFVNAQGFSNSFSGTILDYMNTLSGGTLGTATLFALGVSPYINASIIIQLLAVVFPKLGEMAKDDKEKMNFITRIMTVGLAIVTAIGYAFLLNNYGLLVVEKPNFFHYFVLVSCYCAGAALVMWLAEKINESGIGNGISIILFANIIASFPQQAAEIWNTVFTANGFSWVGLVVSLAVVAGLIGLLLLIVWMSDAERRIPIQYAKRVVGRKMYGGQNTNLPIKVNMSGVMPIIFANSIVAVPATIAQMFFSGKTNWFTKFINNWFNYNTVPYLLVFFVLLIAFAYFYVAISFDPVEVSNNIKNNGGAIPGIRSGRPTVDFIRKILGRITLVGALLVAVVACAPMIAGIIMHWCNFTSITAMAFGGSSLMIVVGVAIETVRELEAQLSLRNYKGFLD